MRFSYWASASQPWAEILSAAQHVEATGWDGVWFADHFMPFTGDVGGPMLECWTVLAGLAAAVPRVRLGSIVAGNTYRHPAVLTKQAVTVDHIAGGRVVLGLGAGWQENEHTAYGIPFFDTKGRLDRLAEACEVVQRLKRDDRAELHGQHYELVDAPLSPKPLGPLPLMVGGGGERRTLRIAAEWADEWNVWGDPVSFAHKRSVLARHCDDVGRALDTIGTSTNALLFLSTDERWLAQFRERDIGRPTIIGTPAEVVDVVAAYRDAGVDELIIPDFTMPDPARKRDTLDLFIEQVAPAHR